MASSDSAQTDRSDRRYITVTMQAPLLEREFEADLARRWLDKRDELALHKLIEAHGRLVVRIAVGFRGERPSHGGPCSGRQYRPDGSSRTF